MKIYSKIIQGSKEWFILKGGKMSASHATAIGNAGKGLQTYVDDIVCNMIVEPEQYTNKDIDRGNELEPIGRQVYEFENNVTVNQVGFITYNDYVGCSPDGLIGIDGGLELKARNNKIHFALLKTGKVDSSTKWQMQMSLLITERKWWDFASYNPNFKQSLYVKRFYPDPEKFEKLLKGFSIGQDMIIELLSNENIKIEL
jgi:hypothetical protein